MWLLAAAVSLSANAMPVVELSVRHLDGTAISALANAVEVAVVNRGPGDAFFYTYTSAFALPEGRTTGSWFTLSDAFGNEVPYRGRWVLTDTAPLPEHGTKAS